MFILVLPSCHVYESFLWISFEGIVLTANVCLNVAHLAQVLIRRKESSSSRTIYFGRSKIYSNAANAILASYVHVHVHVHVHILQFFESCFTFYLLMWNAQFYFMFKKIISNLKITTSVANTLWLLWNITLTSTTTSYLYHFFLLTYIQRSIVDQLKLK